MNLINVSARPLLQRLCLWLWPGWPGCTAYYDTFYVGAGRTQRGRVYCDRLAGHWGWHRDLAGAWPND